MIKFIIVVGVRRVFVRNEKKNRRLRYGNPRVIKRKLFAIAAGLDLDGLLNY
jgi:hypothetical protein